MNERLHLVVSGRVQGVCFRMYTRHEAKRLALTGWVRNLHDGSVEIVAEGAKTDLYELRKWCQRGLAHAHVTHVEEWRSAATNEFSDFDVSYLQGVP